MKKDFFVTDIRAIPKKELARITFNELGTIYIPYSNYLFTSRNLSNFNLNKDIVSLKGLVPEAKLSIYNKDDDFMFNSINVYGKPDLLTKLKKVDYRFSFGNYSDQIRENLFFEGEKILFPNVVVNKINEINKINNELSDLKIKIKDLFPNNKPAYHTRVFNELLKNNPNSDSAYLKKLPYEFIDKTKSIHNWLIKNKENARFKISKSKDNTFFITLKDTSFLSKQKPSYEEYIKQKKAYLDIEIPNYKDDNPTISWVGISYSVSKKEIHTLRDLKFSNYDILKYDNEIDLINGVRSSILNNNPYFLLAYNSKFDLLKLRDFYIDSKEDFNIGVNSEKKPVQEVSTHFFERVGVNGREIIDPLHLAKTLFSYLPNRKLETVSKKLIGKDSLEKIIGYEEMKELEYSNPDLVAKYLEGDVDELENILYSKDIQYVLRRNFEISQEYDIPFFLLNYSHRSITRILDRNFLKRANVRYEQVFPINKNNVKNNSLAKESFKRLIENKSPFEIKPKFYDRVGIISMKYGRALKNILLRTNPDLERLYNMKPISSADKFLLTRYENALSSKLIEEYMLIKKYRNFIDDKIEKLSLTDKVYSIFSNLTNVFYNCEDKEFTYIDIKKKLKKIRNKDYVLNILDRFKENKISPSDFIKFYQNLNNINRKNYLLELIYQTNVAEIDKTISNFIGKTNKLLKENNMDVCFQRGSLLYIVGDFENFEKKYPFSIPHYYEDLIVTNKKAYTKYANSYLGIGKQNNNTPFEIDLLKQLVDSKQDYSKINFILDDYENKLINQEVELTDLVIYSKSSDLYSFFEKAEKKYFRFSQEEGYEKEIRNNKKIKIKRARELMFKPDFEAYLNRFYEIKEEFLTAFN